MVTGDHVLFALGCALECAGELAGDAIVATQMSNVGFERALRAHGIALIRAAVGDRYVLEQMRAGAYQLGGEQSGHVIDFRFNTTGDGPRTAITLFDLMKRTGATLHELVREVVYRAANFVKRANESSRRAGTADGTSMRSRRAANELGDTGRIFVRASGTEPLIRVMAEGDDRELVERLAARVAERIEQEVARFAAT